MNDTLAQFWSDYGAFIGVAFMAFSVIALLWTLIAAFWSLNRTMNAALKLWDESEQTLHRLKTVVRKLENFETDLADRNSRGVE